MRLLDMLVDNNNALGDRDIASDMLKDSKFAVLSLGQAITEIANPQLRQVLTNQLMTAVNHHYELSDLVTKKDWYQPFLAPQQQVSRDMQMANTFS